MGLSANQFAENLMANYSVHEPVDDGKQLPLDLASDFVTAAFPAPEQVLEGGRGAHDNAARAAVATWTEAPVFLPDRFPSSLRRAPPVW